MVRMLHIVGSMAPSGIGNYIMNVYRHIDRSKVQFDFIVHEHRSVSFEPEIEALGGKVYLATQKAESAIKNFNDIKRIVREGKYKIIFRHADNALVSLDLLAAKMGGARQLIPHSHSTSTPNPSRHYAFMPLLNMLATTRFACSEPAGQWLYGDKPFQVVQNAINLEQFSFDNEKRALLRKKLNLNGKIVVGHVGNFMPVKNHSFMIDICKAMIRINPDVVFVFVGDGDLRKNIEEKIANLSLGKNIILTGVRTDTPQLLSAMDAFLFPSFYEGMPIAMVEAQATGLPCITTDVVTRKVDVTNRVTYMALEKPASEWAQRILDEASKYRSDRENLDRTKFISEGFDIHEMVKVYENLSVQ